MGVAFSAARERPIAPVLTGQDHDATPPLLGRPDALFTNFCQGECFRYLRKGQALQYLVELLLRVRLYDGHDGPLPHRIAARDHIPLRLDPELVHAAREHMEESFESGELDPGGR
jgi:hypothetical protein